MTTPTSVRLTPEQRQAVAELAAKRGSTFADTLRNTVDDLRWRVATDEVRPLAEKIAGLFGYGLPETVSRLAWLRIVDNDPNRGHFDFFINALTDAAEAAARDERFAERRANAAFAATPFGAEVERAAADIRQANPTMPAAQVGGAAVKLAAKRRPDLARDDRMRGR